MATIRSMICVDARQHQLLERVRKADTKPWGSTVLAPVMCHNSRRAEPLPESCLIVLAAGSLAAGSLAAGSQPWIFRRHPAGPRRVLL